MEHTFEFTEQEKKEAADILLRAKAAEKRGEVPIGAVVVKDGKIIAGKSAKRCF